MKRYKRLFESETLIGGKGDYASAAEFDPIELEMGSEIVEPEHTNDPEVAAEIAMDHLTDDPNYYSKMRDCGLSDELRDAEHEPEYEYSESKKRYKSLFK